MTLAKSLLSTLVIIPLVYHFTYMFGDKSIRLNIYASGLFELDVEFW